MRRAPRQRLRLRYRKDDVLKYISHRDLLRYMFRLLRRAQIPYATSGRFSPKPRVSFGPALPLGVTADNELADIELASDVSWSAAEISAATSRLTAVAEPRDFHPRLSLLAEETSSLAHQVAGARYRIDFTGNADALHAVLTAQEPLLYQRRNGERRDLRQAILRCSVSSDNAIIDGCVGGENNLNITHLAALLSVRLGQDYTPLHRICLLNQAGEGL